MEDAHAVMTGQPVDLLDLDRDMTEQSPLDPEQERIVELCFFAGLSIEETAQRWADRRQLLRGLVYCPDLAL